MWVTPLGIAIGSMEAAHASADEEYRLYYGEK